MASRYFLVEVTGVLHGENHWTAASHWQTLSYNVIQYCYIEYTSPWGGFKLTMVVVIGIDCTSSFCNLFYFFKGHNSRNCIYLHLISIKGHNSRNYIKLDLSLFDTHTRKRSKILYRNIKGTFKPSLLSNH
jgi:hypothetical protein